MRLPQAGEHKEVNIVTTNTQLADWPGAGLLDKIAKLFTEPLKDAVLGLTHGPRGHIQFGGDLGQYGTFNGGAKKSPPSPLLEVGSDQIQRQVHHVGCLNAGRLADRVVRIPLRDFRQPSLQDPCRRSPGDAGRWEQ